MVALERGTGQESLTLEASCLCPVALIRSWCSEFFASLSFSLFRWQLADLPWGIFGFFFKPLALAVWKWLSKFSISQWSASSLWELMLPAQTGLEGQVLLIKEPTPSFAQKKTITLNRYHHYCLLWNGLTSSWWNSRLTSIREGKAEINDFYSLCSMSKICKTTVRNGGMIIMILFSASWVLAVLQAWY